MNENPNSNEIIYLNEYQVAASTTNIYPTDKFNLGYLALGLTGEAGEVADKIKKIYRDKEGVVSIEDAEAICKELGDTLWYLSQIANNLGFSLSHVANVNIDKLAKRASENKLHGNGDNR